MDDKKFKSALISVFDKEGLDAIIDQLKRLNITIYSTGGTEKYIKKLGVDVVAVEDITSYPSILGGRVKTLHPKVFGGILNRQDISTDIQDLEQYDIPQIDLVIVDLYPFEKTLALGASEQDIIEKIDIGGISLIRAAAKNFKDTICVASKEDYLPLVDLLKAKDGISNLKDRKSFATNAFNVSSDYDAAIFNYFNADHSKPVLKISETSVKVLRYGENPHQKGFFFGDVDI
ncbi:MAG: bifunctional phosphoribosylaminoimidazolecarboxamide formyltransferase/IMP cyclohydrolase PurH, partial [Bacteroidota bacterium]